MAATGGAPRIFVVAGETSGDNLGAKLIQAIRAQTPDAIFSGVGGEAMAREGLQSLFPMTDIAVMGFVPVIKRLPLLLSRIRETAQACIAQEPDVLVIIDSPDFTHRVARRVRQRASKIPIVNYVSPTVWAWRPGRAKAMRVYIDHVLAVLPFEPDAHRRLGGPACTYVGHPLIERFAELRPSADDLRTRNDERRMLLLPGSRVSEVTRLLPVFGEAAAKIARVEPAATFHLPVAPHVAGLVREMTAHWPVAVALVEGEAAKFSAFRNARAALAASGTVTLELGLSQIPMVTAYKVSPIEKQIIQALVLVSTPVLPSLILGREVTPVLLQGAATADALADAVLPLVQGGPERERQLNDFEALDAAMRVPGDNPSAAAAEIVLRYASQAQTKKGA